MSLLFDRWKAAMKPATPEKQVELETFSEHGLGDNLKKEKKKPNHSAESEVKKLNKRLESIDAPFYAVCKDDGTMGYRKVKPSCDPDHPNVVYSRKKAVDEALKEEKEEQPTEKLEKEKKKPKEEEKSNEIIYRNRQIVNGNNGYYTAYSSNYSSHLTKDFKSIEAAKRQIDKWLDEKPKEEEKSKVEKPKATDKDAESAKLMEMLEAKFNKLLESKGGKQSKSGGLTVKPDTKDDRISLNKFFANSGYTAEYNREFDEFYLDEENPDSLEAELTTIFNKKGISASFSNY